MVTVSKEETHKALLERQGFIAGATSEQNAKDKKKIVSFDRIRDIQDKMIKLAKESGWILIEQKVEPDPLEIVDLHLTEEDCKVPSAFQPNEIKKIDIK